MSVYFIDEELAIKHRPLFSEDEINDLVSYKEVYLQIKPVSYYNSFVVSKKLKNHVDGLGDIKQSETIEIKSIMDERSGRMFTKRSLSGFDDGDGSDVSETVSKDNVVAYILDSASITASTVKILVDEWDLEEYLDQLCAYNLGSQTAEMTYISRIFKEFLYQVDATESQDLIMRHLTLGRSIVKTTSYFFIDYAIYGNRKISSPKRDIFVCWTGVNLEKGTLAMSDIEALFKEYSHANPITGKNMVVPDIVFADSSNIIISGVKAYPMGHFSTSRKLYQETVIDVIDQDSKWGFIYSTDQALIFTRVVAGDIVKIINTEKDLVMIRKVRYNNEK